MECCWRAKIQSRRGKKGIPCGFFIFQNKWCHSTHLELNNRSDTVDPPCHAAATVRVITKDVRVEAPTHEAAFSAFIPASYLPQGRGLDSAGAVNLTPFQAITILSSRLYARPHCSAGCLTRCWGTGVIGGESKLLQRDKLVAWTCER